MISITVLCVAPDLDAQNTCICVARVGLRDGSRTAPNGGSGAAVVRAFCTFRNRQADSGYWHWLARLETR